jgi:site-specific recombinase XerD
MSTAALAQRDDIHHLESWAAVGGFLAGYSGHTRLVYQQDLRCFLGWCREHELRLFQVRRAHIELYARTLEHQGKARATIGRRLSTVSSLYRYCVEEELIAHSPATNVCRPRQRPESTISGLDRNELGALLVEAGRDRQEDLTTLASAQLHHGCPRRRSPAA